MRLVFFGTSSFAVPALERLAEDVLLVVSQPDRPSGRGMEMRQSEVKKAALRLGLTVECPQKSRAPEFVDRLKDLDADVFVVASYGQILSKPLLDAPKHGCVNLHASILPKYRGASPIQAAILAGDDETGVTLMKMDVGLDTGDMIDTARTHIGTNETAGELHDRLALIAGDLVDKWIGRLATGDYQSTPQDEARATHTKKIDKADALLDFNRAADAQYRAFRAYTPYPGAHLHTRLGALKVKTARRSGENAPPGTVIATSPNLVVAFKSGSLVLMEVQPKGRRSVSGSEYVNGARIRPGDCLLP